MELSPHRPELEQGAADMGRVSVLSPLFHESAVWRHFEVEALYVSLRNGASRHFDLYVALSETDATSIAPKHLLDDSPEANHVTIVRCRQLGVRVWVWGCLSREVTDSFLGGTRDLDASDFPQRGQSLLQAALRRQLQIQIPIRGEVRAGTLGAEFGRDRGRVRIVGILE